MWPLESPIDLSSPHDAIKRRDISLSSLANSAVVNNTSFRLSLFCSLIDFLSDASRFLSILLSYFNLSLALVMVALRFLRNDENSKSSMFLPHFSLLILFCSSPFHFLCGCVVTKMMEAMMICVFLVDFSECDSLRLWREDQIDDKHWNCFSCVNGGWRLFCD